MTDKGQKATGDSEAHIKGPIPPAWTPRTDAPDGGRGSVVKWLRANGYDRFAAQLEHDATR